MEIAKEIILQTDKKDGYFPRKIAQQILDIPEIKAMIEACRIDAMLTASIDELMQLSKEGKL